MATMAAAEFQPSEVDIAMGGIEFALRSALAAANAALAEEEPFAKEWEIQCRLRGSVFWSTWMSTSVRERVAPLLKGLREDWEQNEFRVLHKRVTIMEVDDEPASAS